MLVLICFFLGILMLSVVSISPGKHDGPNKTGVCICIAIWVVCATSLILVPVVLSVVFK